MKSCLRLFLLPLAVGVACLAPLATYAIDITTSTMPSGMEMVPYNATLQATNGTPPYTWSVAEGYAEASQANSFSAVGTAQGWHADDNCWSVSIPFDFPFYGSNRNTLYINSNGTITFDGYFSQFWVDFDTFRQQEMISALSGDLSTYDPDDIRVEVGPDEATIYWDAHYLGGDKVNVAVTLTRDGIVWMRYGSGNANGGMIGVSGGDGQSYLLSSRSQFGSMENAADIIFAPVGRLPDGLSCSTSGTVLGTPLLAGTNVVTIVVQDNEGSTTIKPLEIVIEPNPNTRPVISSNAPPAGAFSMGEATNQLFRIWAHDPEGRNLTYSWTWDGVQVGSDSSSYTHTTDWGDAGQYELRCYVSDDLWTNILYSQWTVTVLDDNDGDGMPNWQERDLGRDPKSPADGGSPSTLAGTVTGAGIGLGGAYVELRGAGNRVYHRTLTEMQGGFVVSGIEPGHYFLKVGAESYADAWYNNANHRTNAIAFDVPADTVLGGIDFDLASGQSLALVEVTSDPAGADIYLDYWPMGEVTPATINVGEIGDWDWAGYRLASHVITLKKAGHPRPSPKTVPAVEAETVVAPFDLASSSTGAVSIVTTPEGAEVYVDYANAIDGITPIAIGNLSPGSHTILLRKTGHLQPRPITAWVLENETTEVVVPLEPDTALTQMMAEAQSVPQGIPVYVNYLPSGQVTDAVVGLMDPASHTGLRWHSASHTILLRRSGAHPLAPRYVPEIANTTNWMLIHLSVDPTGANDCDDDGIPDWWWEHHGFDPCDPPNAEAPADSSGMSYEDKFRAGLIPGNSNSRFEMDGMQVAGDPVGGRTIKFEFDTVPGRRYVVQARVELAVGGWTNISGVISATAYQTEFIAQETSGAGNQFYRLIVLVP